MSRWIVDLKRWIVDSKRILRKGEPASPRASVLATSHDDVAYSAAEALQEKCLYGVGVNGIIVSAANDAGRGRIVPRWDSDASDPELVYFAGILKTESSTSGRISTLSTVTVTSRPMSF
jgi:hypothetical protein